ncbi:type I polyketide synthase [Nocardia donostiensis]|uniref:Uncharacterized protein n=1 Tax=Nocardia donostiensis TaxID=1538463 RepID=A0A1W0BAE1_9NOCA|nr:type I polyketide synthase [Nocardia donostiensis]ONM49013.1 hypothetical protein B0T46_08680 [Nocardia donostiensis]OQS19493.1 hypothetical protein B0T44_14005 [Nocardia donostiensis]
MTATPAPHPPIAIVGMACRLPAAASITEFWRLLLSGQDALGQPPPGRVGTQPGGYLADIDWFDNDWFGISAREAAVMDPQQRLALEVAVEAIDDAGIGYRAQGCGAAVVFGACGYDHGSVVLGKGGHDAQYAVTGSALSIIANRLSYVLDLHGPSLVVDSACSSSLAAIDLAVRLLTDGTIPFAVVGGVNLALLPHTTDYLAEGGFLAPDGRGKPFDANADGYVRGDGCAVVVLQRSADAMRSGNRIYAEILGTAVGSDGRSNGLYAPNGRAQQDVVRTAWARSGLDPATAGYLECHGTGTALGDAVEVGALAAVLGDERSPTWIGSVKSTVGHLEAAAGVTGLIKTALSIHHGTIVPTVGFRTENPLLRLTERGLRVPTRLVDWRATPAVERLAGVSSFGFGGTNAHVVVRGTPHPHPRPREDNTPVLIPVTGQDLGDLRDHARQAAELLGNLPNEPQTDNEPAREPTLTAFAAGAARLLPELARAAVVAADRIEGEHRLRALAAGTPVAGVIAPRDRRRHGGIVFLFSGQGGQHARMGRALAARYPAFADAITVAADAVAAAGGPRVWTPKRGFVLQAPERSVTELVQPAIFVFQVAAARLLESWGVRPDAVTGHSLGEVAAAAVSGALPVEEAARVVVARSRALGRLDGQGAMAVLEAEPHEVRRLVEPMCDSVGIAAVNGPRSVVVSGLPRYIDTLVRRAKRRDIYARRIAVDFAAHSPQVDAVLPEFRACLTGLAAEKPHTRIYSTARRGETITTAGMDADYWCQNVAATVELAAALDRAAADGMATVLEIGPHPVLLGAVGDHPDYTGAVYPLTTRSDEGGDFLACLAGLYTEGRTLNWPAAGPFDWAPRRRWRRRHFPLVTTEPPFHADDLSDHIVHGEAVVPAAFWLRKLLHMARGSGRSALADFVAHERLTPSALAEVRYQRESVSGRLRAEVTGRGALASARLAGDPTPADIIAWMRMVDANRAALRGMRVTTPDDLYERLRARHLEYGPVFRPLRHIASGRDRAFATFDGLDLHRTATVDGCLQLFAAVAPDELPADTVPLPIAVASAWLSTEPGRRVQEAHAFVRGRSANGLSGDIFATDQNGAPVLALTGVQIRFAALSGGDSSLPSKALAHTELPVVPVRGSEVGEVPPRTLLREIWEPLSPDHGISPGPESGAVPLLSPADDYRPDRIVQATLPVSPQTAGRAHPPSVPGVDVANLRTTADGNHPHPVPEANATNPRTTAVRNHPHPLPETNATNPRATTHPSHSHPAPEASTAHPRTTADPNNPHPGSEAGRSALQVGSGGTGFGTGNRSGPEIRRAVVVGASAQAVRLTRELDRCVPTERVAREPDQAGPIVSAVLASRTAAARTAVVVVWPHENPAPTDDEPAVVTVGRVLDLLQRINASAATASLTVVLPTGAAITHPTTMRAPLDSPSARAGYRNDGIGDAYRAEPTWLSETPARGADDSGFFGHRAGSPNEHHDQPWIPAHTERARTLPVANAPHGETPTPGRDLQERTDTGKQPPQTLSAPGDNLEQTDTTTGNQARQKWSSTDTRGRTGATVSDPGEQHGGAASDERGAAGVDRGPTRQGADAGFVGEGPVFADARVGAIAGLVRSLQLESGRPVRLVWSAGVEVTNQDLLCRLVTGSDTGQAARIPEEVLLAGGAPAVRRFVPAGPRGRRIEIDPAGTYVVTGGLGALGSVAVRWLLDAGAREVVVPTRSPRPAPQLLDGLEDRIVVVRCDVADRTDLDNALRDIRESGCTIRGVVHAAGSVQDAVFEAVSAAQLARLFAPKLTAATNLIELTATDPVDFTLLFSSATGAFGAPGQAAYAAANAAMDALARTYGDRGVTSIGWGAWETGLAAASGGAAHFARAGIVALGNRGGARLLRDTLGYGGYLLAMDYATNTDASPIAVRLRELLETYTYPVTTARLEDSPPGPFVRPEPIIETVRHALAATLSIPPQSVDTAADFNDLGLSSLLAIDMRRTLEHRLNIHISTVELFRHPTVETLAAALSARLGHLADGADR